MKELNMETLRTFARMFSFLPAIFYGFLTLLCMSFSLYLPSYAAIIFITICSISASLFLGPHRFRWIGILAVISLCLIYFYICFSINLSIVRISLEDFSLIGFVHILLYIIYDYVLRHMTKEKLS